MKRFVAGALFGVFIAGGWSVIASQSGQRIYGQGKNSCGTWIEGRRATSHADAAELAINAGREAWVLGFVSAVTLVSPRQFSETDAKGILVAVDKKCDAKPTNPIYGAALEVLDDMSTPGGERVELSSPRL
jgi:hypothetical protein